MATYPAIHVAGADDDLAMAVVDDFGPVAAAPADDGLTIYFAAHGERDAALAALREAFPTARLAAAEVDDEDWARRSQENLGPIVAGRITVRPGDSDRLDTAGTQRPVSDASSPIELVIQPSMGFGTGHHATTRLCLVALQRLDLRGAFMLDVGTGSGVLALAARALGADRALGLDYDPDAIKSASENLPLNPGLDRVSFALFDLTRERLPVAPVVAANLTGALLCRTATPLAGAVAPGGTLILSGILDTERDAVCSAFATLSLTWEAREDEWVALSFNQPATQEV